MLNAEERDEMKIKVQQLAGNQARIMLCALLEGKTWEDAWDIGSSYQPE